MSKLYTARSIHCAAHQGSHAHGKGIAHTVSDGKEETVRTQLLETILVDTSKNGRLWHGRGVAGTIGKILCAVGSFE